jgi:hypothetical protein
MNFLSERDTYKQFFRTMPIVNDHGPNIDIKAQGLHLPSAFFLDNIIQRDAQRDYLAEQ